MQNQTAVNPQPHAGSQLPAKYIIPFLVVFVLVAGVLAYRLAGGRIFPPTGVAVPRSDAMEQRWGIRVTQVGVTADSGLLDFRYIVLDPDKALAIFDNEATYPALVVEDTGEVIYASVPMAHKHDLNPGQVYFVLFYNAAGHVKPGTRLTVIIGDQKLEHVMAQ